MAIGITPKHVEDFPLNDLTKEAMLVLCHEAAEKMGLKLAFISPAGFIAYTDNGLFSRNAEIKITIEQDLAKVQSTSTGSEIIDLGMNKKNVHAFIEKLQELRSALPANEISVKYEQLNARFDTQGGDILNHSPANTAEQVKGFFQIFIPTPGFL